MYIDDYAHHPEEIKACLRSVRDFYPDRKITVLFQPHLYSRTRDFASEFAEALINTEHVALVPGNAFGSSGEGHVRCSYATSINKISEALARIENFLKNHRR